MILFEKLGLANVPPLILFAAETYLMFKAVFPFEMSEVLNSCKVKFSSAVRQFCWPGLILFFTWNKDAWEHFLDVNVSSWSKMCCSAHHTAESVLWKGSCFNCEHFQVALLCCPLSSSFSFLILCCVWSTWLDEDGLNLVPEWIFAPVSVGCLILSVEWKPWCFLSLLLECFGFSGQMLSHPWVHALPHTMNHSHTPSLTCEPKGAAVW